MSPRDRLAKERERLSHVWEGLKQEQDEMRKQTDKLNGLTRQLEGLRAELGALEEAGVKAKFAGDGVGGLPPRDANHAHEDNVMSREGVLVQTCKVENQIKDALDIMEKLLDREKKRLHRVRLFQFRRMKLWIYALNNICAYNIMLRNSSVSGWRSFGISRMAFDDVTQTFRPSN